MDCSTGPGLNDTSGVNINVNFGNSTGEEDTNKQITQVYNINSPKQQGCKGNIQFIYDNTPSEDKAFVFPILAPCPTDKWSVWGSWSSCSKTCGNGTSVRIRDCYTSVSDRLVDPGNCFGVGEETTSCNEADCPRSPGMNMK